jgi:hypothetical protein
LIFRKEAKHSAAQLGTKLENSFGILVAANTAVTQNINHKGTKENGRLAILQRNIYKEGYILKEMASISTKCIHEQSRRWNKEKRKGSKEILDVTWYERSQMTEEKRKGKCETQSHRTDKVGNKGTYEDCILSSRRLFFCYSTKAHRELGRDSETSKERPALASQLGRCKSCKIKPSIQLRGCSGVVEPPERASRILSASLGKRLDAEEAARRAIF